MSRIKNLLQKIAKTHAEAAKAHAETAKLLAEADDELEQIAGTQKRFVGTKDAAKILGMSPAAVRQRKSIPRRKDGSKLRFDIEQLVQWFEGLPKRHK